MPIFFHRENVSIILDEKTVSNWLSNSINSFNKETGDLNVVFCDDEYLLAINNKYLNHDFYTDIITFDYTNNNLISGDLYISIDRVKENAKLNNIDFLKEIYRVIIHGILHLCGYNDKSKAEKRIIKEKENHFLSLIV